jgi:hypothetical protein
MQVLASYLKSLGFKQISLAEAAKEIIMRDEYGWPIYRASNAGRETCYEIATYFDRLRFNRIVTLSVYVPKEVQFIWTYGSNNCSSKELERRLKRVESALGKGCLECASHPTPGCGGTTCYYYLNPEIEVI